MSEVLVLLVQWLLVLNPIGAALYWRSIIDDGEEQQADALAAVGVALALVALAVVLGESVIDALDISPPNWRIAAGVLLILGALRFALYRDPFRGDALEGDGQPRWLPAARLVLWLAGPAALGVAIAHGVDREIGKVVVAVGLALAVTAGALVALPRSERRMTRVGLRELARLTVAGAVIVALRLIMDGVDGV